MQCHIFYNVLAFLLRFYCIKCFFKSINTPMVDIFLSVASVIDSTQSVIAIAVNRPCGNPYWLSFMMLFFKKNIYLFK